MKKIILSILTVTIILFVTIGITYSFFITSIKSNNIIITGGTLDVNYKGGVPIEGNINVGPDKSFGKNTEIIIGLNENSVKVNGNIYLSIDDISDALGSKALKWEVESADSYFNSEEYKYSKSGNFLQCVGNDDQNNKKCISGDKLYLVKNYPLSTSKVKFKIYFWIDSSLSSNDILNSSLSGKIKAESGMFSATFK